MITLSGIPLADGKFDEIEKLTFQILFDSPGRFQISAISSVEQTPTQRKKNK
jgi:hypothetical protein